MKRYSPSATQDWLRCPLYRALRREGWQPRRLGKRDLAAFYGSAFAAGMDVINQAKKAGTFVPDFDIPVATEAAVQHLRGRIVAAAAAGQVFGDADQPMALGLENRLKALMQRFMAGDPIPPTWTVRDAEIPLEAWGHCRPDVVYDSPGGLVVVDYKVKLSLDQRYVAKEIRKWRWSEQRFQYPEAYSDHAGEPVRTFGIVCIVDSPFRTFYEPFPVDPELQQWWRASRERTTWRRMEEDDSTIGLPDMAARHEDEYGPCEFMGACMENRLDPDLMRHEYVKVQRKERV